MRLVKVEFNKFRSIVGEALDIEEDITCLVGINESGKSNALYALEKADAENVLDSADYSRHDSEYGKGDVKPELRLHFKPSDSEEKDGLDALIGENSEIIILSKTGNDYSFVYPAINYEKSSINSPEEEEEETTTDTESTEIEESEDEAESELTDEEKKDIRDKVIKEIQENYLPNFLVFDSVNFEDNYLPPTGEVDIDELVKSPDKYRPVKNLLSLGGISDLTTLVATDEDQRIRRDKMLGTSSDEINEKIMRVVWPVETVEIKLKGDGNILKIQLYEKDKPSPFKPSERSRGLQWALAFNIYFLAESEEELSDSVLLIDEPGVFLHIDSQEKLLEKTFPQIIKGGNQIIYTTHLPYLINAKFPERIRLFEKDNEDTRIGNKAWSQGEFGKLPEPVKTALGIDWSKILQLGDLNVLVEGASDQLILRELYIMFGAGAEISFLPTYGDDKMPSALALVKVERKIGFGIVDFDTDLDDIRERLATVKIPKDHVVQIAGFAEMKSNEIATTEDIVPEDIFIDSVYEVYAPICERRSNCSSLKKEDIPTAYPRVKNTETMFAEKFKAKSHKLFKMDIARLVQKKLASDKTKATTEKWRPAKKVIKNIDLKIAKLQQLDEPMDTPDVSKNVEEE